MMEGLWSIMLTIVLQGLFLFPVLCLQKIKVAYKSEKCYT